MRGDAGSLHERAIDPAAGVEVLRVDKPAVVLGSTQSFDIVDLDEAARLGFDVVRRRSGGGVVILRPGDHLWVDVTVPRGHRLWSDDVERATWWVGETWREVLVGLDAAAGWTVHRDRLVAAAAERLVCFAAVGPGEILRSGRKVVGIAQRRTRDAARFQCTMFRSIEPALYARLLRGGPVAALADAAGVGGLLEQVEEAVVARLSAELSRQEATKDPPART